MGPVLSFRGCEDGNWNLTAIVVTDGAAVPVSAGGADVQPNELWRHPSGTVYRYALSFPMQKKGATTSYTADGTAYDIAVPGQGEAPRMAYASCNGFSSAKLMKGVKDKNCLWKAMAAKHGLKLPKTELPVEGEPLSWPIVESAAPYHLLLQGGDQVYADAMWDTVPLMHAWSQLGWKAANEMPVPADMPAALEKFYFELYTSRWSQPEVARILASVPSIAMWDDHDLMDGWGSYPTERQDCLVFDEIWKAAAKAFVVFQQHLLARERRPGAIGKAAPDWWHAPEKQATRKGAFSFGYTVGKIAILAIDMRSQRTFETRVVSREHWDEIFKWTHGLTKAKVSHLLVMSSIPVVYPGFDTVEGFLGIFPGHQDLEDDLRDHWNSQPHKGERLRLVHNLLDVPDRGIRTTILSGDVHVAALGIVESVRNPGTEKVINQLISSGIVHPGPGGVVLFALQHLFDSADEIDRGIVGRMTQFPGNQARFLGGRNYLSLEPDDESRIWCNWLVENQKFPFTKVIHAL
jgi:hypothetical protein